MKTLSILLIPLFTLSSCSYIERYIAEAILDEALKGLEEFEQTTEIDSLAPDLHEKIDTVEMFYVQFACYCPRWIEADGEKFYEEIIEKDSFIKIQLETDSLEIPDKWLYSGNRFRFIGQFYKEKQIAQDVENKSLETTFRYRSYELVDFDGTWVE